MIFRITVTLMMLFFAVYAFWGNALAGGHFFSPFGILFLVLTAMAWFAWRPICAAFRSARSEAALPILPIARLGASIVEGMQRPPQSRRRGDKPSSSGL